MKSESRCALCQQLRSLRRSHILPEFLYADVYDDQHQFLQSSTDPNERTVKRPTGLYEELLCDACERRLSVWEAYGREVLKGGGENSELEIQKEPWGLEVRGVDYARLKLFGMSLLWRASVSTRPEFAAVQLGTHEEILRKMLDAGDPGRAHDYPFSIVFVPDRQALEIFRHTLAPPQEARYGTHRAYRFLLGATIWLFLASSHMGELDDSILSLNEDGALRVRNGGKPALEFLRAFAEEISAANTNRTEK